MLKSVAIVITCYQSEGNILQLIAELEDVVKEWPQIRFQYIFVDDGSTDKTIEEINLAFTHTSHYCKLISLVRNFGSYNAFLAGLEHANADAYIYLHSDGEDPPQLISQLLKHWLNGFKFVIAHRSHRDDLGMLKPFSILYHKIMNTLMPRTLPPGGFDLILFDEAIKNRLTQIQEKNINLTYLIAWMGYPYVAIPYRRKPRIAGKSQWTFWAKYKLILDSFLGFSYKPVRAIWTTGVLMLFAIPIFWLIGFFQATPNATIIWLLLFCTAVLLISIGIVGEYVWRVFDQVRNRPQYIVSAITEHNTSGKTR